MRQCFTGLARPDKPRSFLRARLTQGDAGRARRIVCDHLLPPDHSEENGHGNQSPDNEPISKTAAP